MVCDKPTSTSGEKKKKGKPNSKLQTITAFTHVCTAVYIHVTRMSHDVVVMYETYLRQKQVPKLGNGVIFGNNKIILKLILKLFMTNHATHTVIDIVFNKY